MILNIEEQLRLELLAPEHTTALYNAIDGSRDHLAAFLPWISNMQNPADVELYIHNCLSLYREQKEVSFVMVDRETVVGRIGIHYINLFNRSGAIGYWITAAAAGKGIVTRATEAMIGYGFGTLDLHRIEIRAAVHNLKSRAIPEKLGFTREGLLRQAELVDGVFFDLALYAMLSHEWKK